MPDILEKVFSYERDRKTALLRKKRFNNHDQNSRGDESVCGSGRENTSTVSQPAEDKSHVEEELITDFVRTEVANDAKKTSKDDEEKVRTPGKKNSTSLLDMFQLNENEDDPIWKHFQNTKSQSLSKAQKKTDFDSSQHMPSTLEPTDTSTREKSRTLKDTKKRWQDIVGSPPDLDDLDNDPMWQGFSSNTNERNPGEKEPPYNSQMTEFADTVLISSCERKRSNFTDFPLRREKKNFNQDLDSDKDHHDKSFSLKRFEDGKKTTESQLVERVLNVQTPSKEEEQKPGASKNKLKRFTFRKK